LCVSAVPLGHGGGLVDYVRRTADRHAVHVPGGVWLVLLVLQVLRGSSSTSGDCTCPALNVAPSSSRARMTPTRLVSRSFLQTEHDVLIY
jgi:hypothetical protein